ncbi:MAG TPA: GxGYxYP family putative glycoside hydrolase, partial [Lacunisphaera sp.]|nr:GxGYxYP family putative glycoside hydrolase [Lacunisphaera sp.]
MRRLLSLLALSLVLLAAGRADTAGRSAFVMRWNLDWQGAEQAVQGVRLARQQCLQFDWQVAGALPEKVLLLSLQGLANRAAPQLYVVHPPEFQWEITGPLFSFYERKHGVKFTELTTADEALTKFAGAAKGYVVWDPAIPATMNVALTLSGLEDALVVTPALIPLAEKHGLKPIDDLRGRYTGQTDDVIYQDAYN